jgi:cold shock CspA family protein
MEAIKMQVPLETTFRDIARTEELEQLILHRMDKMERFCDSITSGEVFLERKQSSQNTGNPFRVRITINVPPARKVVVDKTTPPDDVDQALATLIRESFDAAEIQIKRITEKQRGEVKTHPDQQAMAIVEELRPDDGHGFLRTMDGRRVYFHQNAVTSNDFTRLTVGTGVSFSEGSGDKGPQATVVQIVNKPDVRPKEEPGTG